MFGISLTEMLAIVVIAAIVLKPEDWPKVARVLGRGLRFVQQTSAEARAAVSQGLAEPGRTPAVPAMPTQSSPASDVMVNAGEPSVATIAKNGNAHG